MLESFSVALFCFFMVFVLLGVLYILTTLTTTAVRIIETKTNK